MSSILNQIERLWLQSNWLRYRIPIKGIALAYDKYQQLNDELRAIQRNPPLEHNVGMVNMTIALPGLDDPYMPIYPVALREGIGFII